MATTIISFPCTAQELENALHAHCDHHGSWNATVNVSFDETASPDSRVLCVEPTLVLCASAEMPSETKGNPK